MYEQSAQVNAFSNAKPGHNLWQILPSPRLQILINLMTLLNIPILAGSSFGFSSYNMHVIRIEFVSYYRFIFARSANRSREVKSTYRTTLIAIY